MQIDNYITQGVEIIKDEKVPYGCIRLHWTCVDEYNEVRSGYTDLTIAQDAKVSCASNEPFLLVDNDGDFSTDRDLVQQLLISLADKLIG